MSSRRCISKVIYLLLAVPSHVSDARRWTVAIEFFILGLQLHPCTHSSDDGLGIKMRFGTFLYRRKRWWPHVHGGLGEGRGLAPSSSPSVARRTFEGVGYKWLAPRMIRVKTYVRPTVHCVLAAASWGGGCGTEGNSSDDQRWLQRYASSSRCLMCVLSQMSNPSTILVEPIRVEYVVVLWWLYTEPPVTKIMRLIFVCPYFFKIVA